jgi:hypothetical protein
VVTDVRGERRFISTIARRLDTLGALTRGQRQTGGQGLFDPEDNLESVYAQAALRQFFTMLYQGYVDCCSLVQFEAATGLSLSHEEGQLRETLPGIRQFLNRLLALPIGMQNDLFAVFELILEDKVEGAIAAGTFEVGVETLRAEKFEVVSREVIYTHGSGAETVCLEIEEMRRSEILSAEAALGLVTDQDVQLVVNDRSGHAAVQVPTSSTVNESGSVVSRLGLVKPTGRSKLSVMEFERSHWRSASPEEWRRVWEQEVAAAPSFSSRRFFLICGLLLPIWNSLDSENMRVFRLQTDSGERLLGRVIEPEKMQRIAETLGLRQVDLTPGELFELVMVERQSYGLPGGLVLRASGVMGELRLEIAGEHLSDALCEQLKAVGCFTEVIDWRRRLFIPAAVQEAVVVIEKVLELLR